MWCPLSFCLREVRGVHSTVEAGSSPIQLLQDCFFKEAGFTLSPNTGYTGPRAAESRGLDSWGLYSVELWECSAISSCGYESKLLQALLSLTDSLDGQLLLTWQIYSPTFRACPFTSESSGETNLRDQIFVGFPADGPFNWKAFHATPALTSPVMLQSFHCLTLSIVNVFAWNHRI